MPENTKQVNPFFYGDGNGISGETNTRGFQRMLVTESVFFLLMHQNEGTASLKDYYDKAIKHYNKGQKGFRLMVIADRYYINDESDEVEYLHAPSDEFYYIIDKATDEGKVTYDEGKHEFSLTDKGKRHAEMFDMMGYFRNAQSWIEIIDPKQD
jgi:hypothetical protein